MNPNEELITKFYSAFKIKDFKTMQSCYADNAIFNDSVFKNLDAAHVKAMCEMLCVKGKDLQLEFTNVSCDEKTGHAEWTATYTQSDFTQALRRQAKSQIVEVIYTKIC